MLKNRLLFAAIFIASFVFVYFYGGKVPYMLFYTVIALPLLSFLYALTEFLGLRFRQNIDNLSVIKGDKLHFEYSLRNRGFMLYPYIKVHFHNADRIFASQFGTRDLSLLPSSLKTYTCELECKYRGAYTIGIKRMEVEDFLGIFRFTHKPEDSFLVTVYPKIIELSNFIIKPSFHSESMSAFNSNHQDSSIVSDIRKYAQGDSIRSIHWKLSAKLNDLMVKKMESSTETQVVLVLDLKKPGLDPENSIILEDKIIEAVISVLHYSLSRSMRTTLMYYKGDIHFIEGTGPSDFNSLYDFLSFVEFDQEAGIEGAVNLFVNDGISKANVVVFTGSLSDALNDYLIQARRMGHETSLVYISPGELTGIDLASESDALRMLVNFGIHVYPIRISDNIKKVLENHNSKASA